MILIVQDAFAASDEGQLFVCEKPADTLIPDIVSATFPVLVTVIVCGTLLVPRICVPKLKLLGAKEIAGCGAPPVPFRLTLRVLLVIPSVPLTLNAPEREPGAVGVNTTVYVHEVPPSTPALEQLLPCEKSTVI